MQLTKTIFSDSLIVIEKMTVESWLCTNSEFLCIMGDAGSQQIGGCW